MFTRYVTNTYEIVDTYRETLINAKDAKVTIEPSSDNHTKLVFFEKKRRPYEFFITDGTLTIKPTKTKWYNSLTIGINRSEIKLYVPNLALKKLSVKATVGRVDIHSINCSDAIEININTGNINLKNVYCKTLDSKGNTGSASLSNCTAEKSISIKRNTGKVSLNDCSAPEIFVKTNTGRVSGKLPSNTVFVVRTHTGKVETPKAPIGETIGGSCEITTNTGSVNFE